MSKGKILIVEDNEQMANVLGLHLSELGYEHAHAADGDTGLSMALSEKYELIILDVMLPGLSGLEVCRAIREAGNAVPIMMLTSKSEEIDTVVGLEVGADDYITKPFRVAELMARVKAQLRRSQEFGSAAVSADQSAASVLSFGDLEIDSVKRIVTLQGKKIDLTAKEFDVLAYLAAHPGRPFTREQILRSVWGSELDAYEYAVNSLIMRLRKKIEADVANPIYIQTVRGVGYRFVDPQDPSD